MPLAQAAHRSEATISAISFSSCVPAVASGKAERMKLKNEAARWHQSPAEINEIAEIVASLLYAACAKGTFLYFFYPAEIKEITEILLRLADSEGVLSFISFISAGHKNL